MFFVFVIYMAITTTIVILEEIGSLDIDVFTQIYFGMTFCGFMMLTLFIPRQHDQLGLWTETVLIFVLGAVLIIIIVDLWDDVKRVWLSFDGAFGILLDNSYSLRAVIM